MAEKYDNLVVDGVPLFGDAFAHRYLFVHNDPANAVDYLGLFSLGKCFKKFKRARACASLPGLAKKCGAGLGDWSGDPEAGKKAKEFLDNLSNMSRDEQKFKDSDGAIKFCEEKLEDCPRYCDTLACLNQYARDKVWEKYKDQIAAFEKLVKDVAPCVKLANNARKCFAK